MKYIACILLLGLLEFIHADEASLRLFAQQNGAKVRLRWKVSNAWPERTAGFAIKRRGAGAPATAWAEIKASPIYPSLTRSRKWPLSIYEKDRIASLTKRTEEFITRAKKEASRDVILADLRKMSARELSGFWMMLSYQEDSDLIYGFGTEDAGEIQVKTYEYGLFCIDDAGVEAKEPITTVTLFTEADLLEKIEECKPTAELVNNKIQILLKTPKKLSSECGISGFRAIPVDMKRNHQKTMIVRVVQDDDGVLLWRGKDPSWDVKKPRAYELWPMDGFGKSITRKRLAVRYDPFVPTWAKVETTPIVLEPLQAKHRSVTVRWKFPKALEPAIDHWVLERLADKNAGFKVIEKNIGAFKREIVDGSIPLEASAVIYRIKAVAGTKSVQSEALAILVEAVVVRPGKPESFKVEFDKTRGVLVATWKAPEGVKLDGYLVSLDDAKEGEVRRQNNDTIKKTRYEFKAQGNGGRNYTLKVKALSAENHSGEIAEKTVFVPLKTLPKPNLRRYRAEGKKGAISWEWRYPENVKELLGFRMYRNGKMVADEKVLGPKTRNWTFEDVVPKKKETFHLKAVSKYGSVSESSRTKSFMAKE